MKINRRAMIAACAVTLPILRLSPGIAAEPTVVDVSLWDKGADSMAMLGQGPKLGMAMTAGADMTTATMGITVDKTSVPAGEISFKATNSSKDMIHEMVVAPVADQNTPLPYDAQSMKVDEDAAGHLGEVAELEPGQSGTLTMTMKPGTYILYCNIPGHYELGMWTLITVTG